MKKFVLADCNNFFVSCERVFNPQLIGKAVVVLSGNDGCVIARSNEAKGLGIAMGAPAFTCKQVFKQHGVIQLSSNFALYGDMADRVMHTIAGQAAALEIYSIDEAFFFFAPTVDHMAAAHALRNRVYQHVGIPISIGIGPTKTLAKIANRIAKKSSQYAGVFDITNHPQQKVLLENIPVEEVWGIGHRSAKLLHKYGIRDAYGFATADEQLINRQLTVLGRRVQMELQGTVCYPLNEEPSHEKQGITVSRLFGKIVTTVLELQEAASYHIARAAEKLRSQNSSAKTVTVFVLFKTELNDAHRSYDSHTITLPVASNFTPTLIAAARQAVRQLFKPGILYKKVGVTLGDISSANHIQLHTHAQSDNSIENNAITHALDNINAQLGAGTVFFASTGTTREWRSKSNAQSPRYTTEWNEILTIQLSEYI
ncbi:MAG: Y-family DNA polymerase [Candidatus Babeliales bacterium]